MNRETDQLIGSLGAQLAPVRPLRAPVLRALIALAVIAALAAWPVAHFANLQVFLLRNAELHTALECAASLLTGIVATVAAFHLSVPDRSARWALAPLPPLLLWLAAAGAGCLSNGIGHVNWDCVLFTTLVGAPLLLGLLIVLRRARPLAPAAVAWTGGLGAAGLAAFLLQFFHPFDVSVMDLLLHALAVGALLLLARVLARPVLA
jgi:hypothetical protein